MIDSSTRTTITPPVNRLSPRPPVQGAAMGHHDEERSAPGPLREKRGLVNRVRWLRGQVDAIERALDKEASCSDLLQKDHGGARRNQWRDGRGPGRTRAGVSAA